MTIISVHGTKKKQTQLEKLLNKFCNGGFVANLGTEAPMAEHPISGFKMI